jgi:hypothetical protein
VAANCLDKGPGSAYGYKYFLHYVGDVAIPNYPGADTSVAGQYTTVSAYTLPILEFANNEVYGATESGMQAWWLGTNYKTPASQQESIIEGVSHVLGLSEGLSKLIAIDEQPNHQIVHLFRLGKTNRAAH